MDFDLSKENIQPLRGGRNAQQLEMALQAQTQQEYQRQLQAQKEEFEALIRNYQGEDPLEPYYNYIAWIEQSYPKSGHEGNFQMLLEHCLKQFENDPRYTNDRRFCKLWIKYIDTLAEPTEPYLMLKSKNICTGCADFYKAWAYYHEMAGDFQKANNILEDGKKNLAQPYEDLEIAQKNLITAAGETMINGPNQSKLMERREAMTSLHTFRGGRVGSVRVPSSHSQTTVGHSASGHSNAPINVYEEQSAGPSRFSALPPDSIVGAMKFSEVKKENKLAPGTWVAGNYSAGYKPKSKNPGFIIMEEDTLKNLCPNMPPTDSEEFSWFKRVPLMYPEEILPHHKRMYPKAKVYCDPNTEYCLEELEMSLRLQRQQPTTTEAPITTINLDSDSEDEDEDIQEVQVIQVKPEPNFEIFSEDHQNFLQDVFNRSNEPVLTNNNELTIRSKQLPKPVVSSRIQSPAGAFTVLISPNQSAHTIYKGPSPSGTPQKGFGNVSVVQSSMKFEILEDNDVSIRETSNNKNSIRSARRPCHQTPSKFQILEDSTKKVSPNASLSKLKQLPKPVVSSRIQSPAGSFTVVISPNQSTHTIYKGPSPSGTPQKGFGNVSIAQSSMKFEIFQDNDVSVRGTPNNKNSIRNGPSTSSNQQQSFTNVSVVKQGPMKFDILEDDGSTCQRTPNKASISQVQRAKVAAGASPQVNMKQPNNSFKDTSNVNSPVTFGFSWTPPSNSNVGAQQEQSPMVVVQPKSIKSNAFRELAVDELVETGSRHGGAMAAQPTDGAKNIEEDDDMGGGADFLDATCSTQQFNFNLNVMKVSTPQTKKTQDELTDPQNSRRNLFCDSTKTLKEPKALSTIMEETKSCYGYSSSSSSGATTKSIINSQNKMSTISEEHTGYLAQNSMANAELRRSLLGNLIDDDLPVPPAVQSPTPVTDPSHQQEPPQFLDDLPPPHDDTIPLPLAKGEPITTVPYDPFAPNIIETLLDRVGFPGVHREGYVPIEGCPRICVKQDPLYISSDQYIIEKLLGKGQFGTVYKAFDRRRRTYVALKLQKPSNKWEFYICRELAARLQDHDLRDRYMNISLGYFSSQCSILVSKYEPFGSLLDVVNVLKVNGTRTKEPLCFYMTLEMLTIVKAMHEVKIIHADIKPDNFLVVLQNDNSVKLQLIDFGCSIDMTLFPEGATFRQEITTENFVCCEVLDRRPWSYHTDLFCIAASAHVLLFNDYIQMKKVDGAWSISARLPRYCKIDLWNMFFSSLLNQQAGPADIATLELLFREEVEGPCKKDLPSQIRHVVNLLKKR